MAGRGRLRVLLQKDVVINGAIKGYVLDISEEGMYIHTTAEFLPKSVIEIDFDIDGKQISTKAAIRHTEPGVGVGIKFLNLSPYNLKLIRGLIKSRSEAETAERPAKQVLFAGSDQRFRTTHKSRLIQDGCCVLETADGVDALKVLQQELPDVMILDLDIDGISAFRLLQLMKLNPDLSQIPVIVLSSRVIPEEMNKAVSLGAKEYLVKATTSPIKLAEIVSRIFSEIKGR